MSDSIVKDQAEEGKRVLSYLRDHGVTLSRHEKKLAPLFVGYIQAHRRWSAASGEKLPEQATMFGFLDELMFEIPDRERYLELLELLIEYKG